MNEKIYQFTEEELQALKDNIYKEINAVRLSLETLYCFTDIRRYALDYILSGLLFATYTTAASKPVMEENHE